MSHDCRCPTPDHRPPPCLVLIPVMPLISHTERVPQPVPLPTRRCRSPKGGELISIVHLALPMSNEDFVVADTTPCHSVVTDPKATNTIFDDFEPAFAIVEYLAMPKATVAFLLEVFSALELAVVARYPHTCRNQVG